MKFDFVIGNPPYQEDKEDNGRKPPIYHKFMNEAFRIGNNVELITPARFLFNAGQTPKVWNDSMLHNRHFKVLTYESDAEKIFANTLIKGGVCVSYYSQNKDYGEIDVFTEYSELNQILRKVQKENDFMDSIIYSGVPYKFSELLKKEHEELISVIGSSFDLRTNILDKLNNKIFFEEKNDNTCVRIFGLLNKKREYLWIKKSYLIVPDNFEYYKVFMSKANGKGEFGEAMSKLIIGEKNVRHTQSFLSAGKFKTLNDALNIEKYIKTKFSRALLSILRKTQDTTAYKWKYVPLQDFTSSSDIDWSQSIANIDKQLYKKYNLSNEEINFIEANVKEMK